MTKKSKTNNAHISPSLPNTWIFQANPTKYQIRESLKVESEEFWNLRQNAKKIAVGDRVLIWISGKEAGIYAVGKILTMPELMPDSTTGMGYWNDVREGLRPRPRALVRYDRVLLDRPLLKVFLIWDPAIWNHKIIRAPMGTNFSVSEVEWNAIKTWLDN